MKQEKNTKILMTFVRIEQLYPFPAKTLANILKRYTKARLSGVGKSLKIWALNTVRNYIDRTLEIVNLVIKL